MIDFRWTFSITFKVAFYSKYNQKHFFHCHFSYCKLYGGKSNTERSIYNLSESNLQEGTLPNPQAVHFDEMW